MQVHLKWVGAIMLATLAVGCDRKGSTTQPSDTAAIKQDLKQLGQDVGNAGKDIGAAARDKAGELKDKAVPMLQDAGSKVKEGVHDLAEKVAEKTATQPATQQ